MKLDARSGLTEDQVEHLRELLLRARTQLLDGARVRRDGERELDEPEDPASDPIDQATREQSESLLHALDDRTRDQLALIERALDKIEQGGYGVCEATGEPIGYERLQAQPWARTSTEREVDRERNARGGDRRHPSL